MGQDFARATGQPKTITLNGVDYKVGKLTPRDYGELQALAKEFCPDPRRIARELMGGLPDEVAKCMWLRACDDAKDWPPQLGSEKMTEIMITPIGQAKLLYLSLKKHNPITEEQAGELAGYMTEDDMNAIMGMTASGELGDPKSPATGTGTD